MGTSKIFSKKRGANPNKKQGIRHFVHTFKIINLSGSCPDESGKLLKGTKKIILEKYIVIIHFALRVQSKLRPVFSRGIFHATFRP